MLIKKRKSLILSVLMIALLISAPLFAEGDPIAESDLRIHFQNSSQNYENLGLWLWKDVVEWSEDKGAWPTGATPFPPNKFPNTVHI